jgi:hypothetical protein
METCGDDLVFVVIGHRFDDSEREVAESEGSEFARQNSVPFFEVDSRTDRPIDSAMHAMLTKIWHSHTRASDPHLS